MIDESLRKGIQTYLTKKAFRDLIDRPSLKLFILAEADNWSQTAKDLTWKSFVECLAERLYDEMIAGGGDKNL